MPAIQIIYINISRNQKKGENFFKVGKNRKNTLDFVLEGIKILFFVYVRPVQDQMADIPAQKIQSAPETYIKHRRAHHERSQKRVEIRRAVMDVVSPFVLHALHDIGPFINMVP